MCVLKNIPSNSDLFSHFPNQTSESQRQGGLRKSTYLAHMLVTRVRKRNRCNMCCTKLFSKWTSKIQMWRKLRSDSQTQVKLCLTLNLSSIKVNFIPILKIWISLTYWWFKTFRNYKNSVIGLKFGELYFKNSHCNETNFLCLLSKVKFKEKELWRYWSIAQMAHHVIRPIYF